MPNWSRTEQRDYTGESSWSTDSGGSALQSMRDQDLSGTDLKFVEWSIVFTKRDFEATLQPLQTDVIDYATNGASFGALKVGEFLTGPFTAPGITRPTIWVDRNYPPNVPRAQATVTLAQIPRSDLRYITIVYKVKDRLVRQAREYDRLEVEALQRIGGDIHQIWGNPQPYGNGWWWYPVAKVWWHPALGFVYV